jgi:rsbT co-antagonist protein RsbR
MTTQISSWLAPTSSDPDIARQEYTLNRVLVLAWAAGQAPLIGVLSVLAMLPFYALAYWLGRRGQVQLAAYVPAIALLLLMLAATYQVGIGHGTLVGLAMVTTATGVLLGIRPATIVALLSAAAYVTLGLIQKSGKLPAPQAPENTLAADGYAIGFGLVAISLLVWFSSHEVKRALARARESERQIQIYRQELETIQEQLERQVEERTRDLKSFAGQLQLSLEEQQRLWETVQQLSIPIVPVHEGIIVMPLIGHIDGPRAERMVDDLLISIEEQKAKLAIIDVTGLPVVDSHVANTLLQAANAASLMGTEIVLVGIRPEVADTVVRLGLELGSITIQRDLQAGVNYALADIDRDLSQKVGKRERGIE